MTSIPPIEGRRGASPQSTLGKLGSSEVEDRVDEVGHGQLNRNNSSGNDDDSSSTNEVNFNPENELARLNDSLTECGVNKNQTEKGEKNISWGSKEVIIFSSECSLPEGYSKKVEHSLAKLLLGKQLLNTALYNSNDTSSRRNAIKAFNESINSINEEEKKDPVIKNILQVAHIFLARAYCGFVASAFLHEMKGIENDSEMRERYKKWPQLLKTHSIFIDE